MHLHCVLYMITLWRDLVSWSMHPGFQYTASNRRGKSGGLAWKQSGMWEYVNKFPKTKRRKYPQYTSEWGCVIMCKSNRPFSPANDYSEFISLYSFTGINGRLELHIITQPHSEVYWVYFRRLVFENSLTKHNKLSRFSYSVVIFPPAFPHTALFSC